MTLGERVKLVRKNNKLNQTDFANRLGISQTHVSKIEKDVENPSETLLKFIVYMFGVDYNWLKKGEGDYNRSLGCSAEDCLDKFVILRHRFEEQMRHMNSDSIYEYVNSIQNLEYLLNCFDVPDIGSHTATQYYASISKLTFHLLLFFVITNKDELDERRIPRVKKMISEDIETMLQAYKSIMLKKKD